MASKQASVFIIDVNQSMHTISNGSSMSNHAKAHRIVSQILQKKIISGRKTDVVGVVFVGSKDTKNHLATEDTYRHVSIHGFDGTLPPLMMTDIDLFRHVYFALEKESSLADVSDGMIVGFDMLLSHCKHYKFEKKVYLLTDAANPIDDDCMESLQAKSAENDVKWSLIGFDFDDLENEDRDSSSDKSEIKRNNEKILYEFVKTLQGQFFHGDEAYEMMEQLQSKSINPTTSYRGPLVLGDPSIDPSKSLSIPIYLYPKTMEIKLPTSKKWSALAESLSQEERASVSFGQVESETSYKIKPKEDESTEDDVDLLEAEEVVDKDQLVQAYRYGKSSVVFSEEDSDLAKLSTEKSFQLLGFIPLSKVKREAFIDRVYAVVPDPNSKRASEQLYALMAAMHEKDCAAVARYCRIANAAPVLGAILANKKGYGYFVPMPFLEDVRYYSFPSFQYLTNSVDGLSSRSLGNTNGAASSSSGAMGSSYKRSANTFGTSSTNTRSLKRSKLHTRQGTPEDALKAIDELIDSFDLMEADDGEEAYRLKYLLNPGFQHVYRCISDRALNPKSNTLPPIDERILAGLKPLPHVLTKSENAVKELARIFNVSKNLPKEKRQSRKQRAGHGAPSVTSASETGLLARLGEQDFFGEADASTNVTSISTMDPSGDFEAMIKNPELVGEAFKGISQVIPKLLAESVGSQLFSKAFASLETFRSHSIQLSRAHEFNECLKELKNALLSGPLSRQSTFWHQVIQVKSMTLIKLSECDGGVSDQEASEFLSSGATESGPAQAVASDEPDEDDLLDMLD